MNEIIDKFLTYPEVIVLFRMFLACLMGALIGFEREKYGRPAGLRTHMIVALGAALAMLISKYGFNDVGDPGRLAAQVISGIGFLGAGAIIVRGDRDITGITTAATIWTCAIIGLACGNGFYLGSLLSTAMLLIILSCFTSVERRMSVKRKYKSTMSLIIKHQDNVVERVRNLLDKSTISLLSMEYRNMMFEDEKAVKIVLSIDKYVKVQDLNELLVLFDNEFELAQCKINNNIIDVDANKIRKV